MVESKSSTRLKQNTDCTVLNIEVTCVSKSQNRLLKGGQNKVKTKLSKVKLSTVHPQVPRETGVVPLGLPVRRSTTKSSLLPRLARPPRVLAASAAGLRWQGGVIYAPHLEGVPLQQERRTARGP